jgi:phosphatidylglycerophosphate synthase
MSWNLNDLRDRVYPIIDPITNWLVRRGVHPNLITSSGFAVTILAGFMYGIDHVRTAGLLVLLGGAHDIFDGRVARLSDLHDRLGHGGLPNGQLFAC